MRTFRSKSGPFSERPHFEPNEIDQICSDELRKQGLFPNSPEAIRIDRFVEKRFGVVPHYEDLPAGVLGFVIIHLTQMLLSAILFLCYETSSWTADMGV